jgi:hypothetical protein
MLKSKIVQKVKVVATVLCLLGAAPCFLGSVCMGTEVGGKDGRWVDVDTDGDGGDDSKACYRGGGECATEVYTSPIPFTDLGRFDK